VNDREVETKSHSLKPSQTQPKGIKTIQIVFFFCFISTKKGPKMSKKEAKIGLFGPRIYTIKMGKNFKTTTLWGKRFKYH
jgi:hypothetical protein